MIFDELQIGDWFKHGKRILQKLAPKGLEERRAQDIYGRIFFLCTLSKVEKVDSPFHKITRR